MKTEDLIKKYIETHQEAGSDSKHKGKELLPKAKRPYVEKGKIH